VADAPTFLGRDPGSSRGSWARSPAPCPPCPGGGRLRWRVTGFWAGWRGVASAGCCEPRWAARWGSWERGPGCPGAPRCGPPGGRLASGGVYCDSCWETGARQSGVEKWTLGLWVCMRWSHKMCKFPVKKINTPENTNKNNFPCRFTTLRFLSAGFDDARFHAFFLNVWKRRY